MNFELVIHSQLIFHTKTTTFNKKEAHSVRINHTSERIARVGQQTQRIQIVVHNHGLEHVKLKVTVAARHCDRHVITHHL